MADFETVHDALDHTGLTGVGGGGISSGTSFPGTPSADDLYFHETYAMLFVYDGTRWVCTCPHAETLAGGAATVVGATTTNSVGARIWLNATDDLWLIKATIGSYVATTNTGTHYWTMEVRKAAADGTGDALLATRSTNADSANNYVGADVSIGAVVDVSATPVIYWWANKVSSPGAIHANIVLHYRIIGV